MKPATSSKRKKKKHLNELSWCKDRNEVCKHPTDADATLMCVMNKANICVYHYFDSSDGKKEIDFQCV